VAERRVKVTFSAEISNFRRAMDEAAQATTKAKKASEEAGKAADRSTEDIKKQALAHHEAAKAAGLQYDNTGQLVTMNGKAVSSQQAATHGLQTFSAEAYLAGRAAVAAGEDAEAAAKASAEAEAKAAAAIEKRREAMENVGAVAATAGALTLAGVGLAVKSYADFDKQMSSVDAATHETAGNMQRLRDAAVDAGADTAFSAVDAARGIEEMAKAGVSTADILGGGLSGALSLAAAGSLDVGEAAELASSALTQFKLKGSDLPHIADLMAAGAGKAQGSVHDLGEALNQSGLVAAQLGLTIEETTGGLAAFASAGLTGSDAGTSFKTMLAAVTPNSKEAAKAMEELGLSAFDSQGKFIGLSEYAGVLKSSLSGMTDEQRIATMETIFGSDAIRAASVLYDQGSEGVQKWEDAVNDAGFAADTAARMQNNLAGDLEKLGGSFDTVLIQSGSGANEVLRGMVQGLEDVVDAVGKVPAPVLGAVTGLAALVGGAALIAGTLITVIPKIRDTRDALNELAPAGGKARKGLETAGKYAERAAAAYAALALAAKLASDATDGDRTKTTVEGFNNALAGVSKNADNAKKSLDGAFNGVTKPGNSSFTAVNDLDSALKRVFNPQFNDNMNDFWSTVTGNNATSGMNVTKAALADLDKSIASMAQSGNLEDAAAGFNLVAEKAKEQGIPVEKLVELFPEYKDAILSAKTANGETQVSQEDLTEAMLKADPAGRDAAKAQEILDEAVQNTGVALEGVIEDMDKFLEQLFASGLITMSARDANAAYHEALRDIPETLKTIAESGGKMGAMLNENATDFNLSTQAGALANAAFQDVARKGMAEVEAKAKEGVGLPDLQAKLSTTYDDLLIAADGMGITGDAAINLAREVLGVPDGVDIHTWMDTTARAEADRTKQAIDNIPKQVFVDIWQTTHDITLKKTIEDPGGMGSGNGDGRANGSLRGGLATGGRVPGYADGGQLPTTGPGTDRTDGFLGISSAGLPLARVDAGEWIIKRSSSDRYNRELAAINAGTFPKLPGYANGGREWSAQSLGYAPYRADSQGRGGMTIEKVEINEQRDPGATFMEFSRRTNALAI
jgi:TP901 family phage tail tape measure protein